MSMNITGNPLFSSTKNKLIQIETREWIWVSIVSFVIIALSTFPYIIARYYESADKVFNGAVINRQDYAFYIAMMRLGNQGEWVNRFLFSSEAPLGAYFRMSYIFLGHVSRTLGLGLEFTYHLARIFLGCFACYVIYVLISICFRELSLRRLAFLLSIMGSGIGWLQLMINRWPESVMFPIDFWFMDPYIFFELLTFPHFIAVTVLLSLMIILTGSFLLESVWWKWLLIMFCGLFIQTMNPLAVILGDIAVFGAFATRWWQDRKVSRRDVLLLLLLAVGQTPLFIYNVVIMTTNPYWGIYLNQNVTLSPQFSYYLTGFLTFWPFALMGFYSFFRIISKPRNNKYESTILSIEGSLVYWAIFALILAYSPINIQRRFMHAYALPLAIISVVGIRDILFPWIQKRGPNWISSRYKFFSSVFVFFASISSIALVLSSSVYLSQLPRSLYDSASLVEAVDWIGERASSNDVVLSAELTGQLVASQIVIPVYLGHPIETLNYQQKLADVEEFYTQQSNIELLRSAGVRWIIYGPSERELGVLSQNRIQSHMEDVYQVGDVKVFKMKP